MRGRLALGLPLFLHLACGRDPRAPVEAFLGASKKGLTGGEYWMGGEASRKLSGLSGYRYERTVYGNEGERERLEGQIAAEEKAEPILSAEISEATDQALRSGQSQKKEKLEAALQSLRDQIQKDKDRSLELLSHRSEGGTYLDYRIELRQSDGAAKPFTYRFEVKRVKRRWLVAACFDEAQRERKTPTPEEVARKFVATAR